MQHVIDVIAANGVPFRCVAEFTACRYTKDSAWFVTVYDRRYPHTEHGQHTGGRYYASTLLENVGAKHGLNVHGGVPEWTIDATTYAMILGWLGRITALIPVG